MYAPHCPEDKHITINLPNSGHVINSRSEIESYLNIIEGLAEEIMTGFLASGLADAIAIAIPTHG